MVLPKDLAAQILSGTLSGAQIPVTEAQLVLSAQLVHCLLGCSTPKAQAYAGAVVHAWPADTSILSLTLVVETGDVTVNDGVNTITVATGTTLTWNQGNMSPSDVSNFTITGLVGSVFKVLWDERA